MLKVMRVVLPEHTINTYPYPQSYTETPTCMTAPFVPPDVRVFYEAPPAPAAPPEVIPAPDRPYTFFESFYSEPPMTNQDQYTSPQEAYSAKEFEQVWTDHNEDSAQEMEQEVSEEMEGAGGGASEGVVGSKEQQYTDEGAAGASVHEESGKEQAMKLTKVEESHCCDGASSIDEGTGDAAGEVSEAGSADIRKTSCPLMLQNVSNNLTVQNFQHSQCEKIKALLIPLALCDVFSV